MFKHNTKNSSVLMYIDSIKKEGSKYTVLGWLCHKVERIKSISLDERDISFVRQERLDVKNIYSDIKTSEVGIVLFVEKEDFTKKISITLDSGELIEDIGTLEKWYIKYSGFNKSYSEVVVVENFYADPDAIRNFAINNLEFNPSGYHKGARSSRFILDGTKERFEQILGRKVINWEHPSYANGAFQFCVKDDPIVYHTDQQMFAGVVFLTPNAPLNSGTSTFKSKKTGRLKFDKSEISSSIFNETFSDELGNLNFYSNSNLELVDRVANIYNRLVLFESRSIHAAGEYFGDSIHNGRLFHIFFFDIE